MAGNRFVLIGWQDLRFDDRARKELLLRTEEFQSKLWFDVEERKSQATAVLRTIKADGRLSGFYIFSTVSTALQERSFWNRVVGNICNLLRIARRRLPNTFCSVQVGWNDRRGWCSTT